MKRLITIALIAGATSVQALDPWLHEMEVEDAIHLLRNEVEDLRDDLEAQHNPYAGTTWEDIKRQNMQWQERISRRYSQGDVEGALREQAELDAYRVRWPQLRAPVRKALPVNK